MSTSERSEVASDLQYKIRSVQSLLAAISKFDPGGNESRLADMAEKQLDEIHDALDKIG